MSKKLIAAWVASLMTIGGSVAGVQFLYHPQKAVAKVEAKIVGEPLPEDVDLAPVTLTVAIPTSYKDLLEATGYGQLPRISIDGKKPWMVYSSRGPDRDDTRPRIGLIITNMGLRSEETRLAIDNLPARVTLAFSPYGRELDTWAERARGRGHELLMMLPMEPEDYPNTDPGNLTLRVDFQPRENKELLLDAMARMTGYVGMISDKGSRFTAAVDQIQGPILDEFKERGLLWVDSVTNPNTRSVGFARARDIPTTFVTHHLDEKLLPSAIQIELDELVGEALQRGVAIAYARPRKATLDLISAWAETLDDKGVVLAPVSSLVSPRK